jgi:hypothetical protein
VPATLTPSRHLTHAPPPTILHAPVAFDHLILGCNDLDLGIALVEERTGVRAAAGGAHPGRGTRNALLALGPGRYLEIIARDPAQSTLAWFPALAEMREPRLLGWAARTPDLDALAPRLRGAGIGFQGPTAGSRTRADGTTLRWRTLMLADDQHGLLPFFIAWAPDAVHPSADSPSGCVLTRFAIEAPDPDRLAALTRVLGVSVPVAHAPAPRLLASVEGPAGTLDVTS